MKQKQTSKNSQMKSSVSVAKHSASAMPNFKKSLSRKTRSQGSVYYRGKIVKFGLKLYGENYRAYHINGACVDLSLINNKGTKYNFKEAIGTFIDQQLAHAETDDKAATFLRRSGLGLEQK